jgi:heme-degrading monooxygenase HmoA
VPFVAITRLRVRSWRYLPVFFVQALRSARQAARAEGNLVTRLLRDRRNTFWTSTIWRTEASMRAFMLAGVHRRVMRKLPDWCDEAALVHWTQESTEPLPTWEEAYARLKREGRPSRVNHPSPAHVAYEFPQPREGRAELRFK